MSCGLGTGTVYSCHSYNMSYIPMVPVLYHHGITFSDRPFSTVLIYVCIFCLLNDYTVKDWLVTTTLTSLASLLKQWSYNPILNIVDYLVITQ